MENARIIAGLVMYLVVITTARMQDYSFTFHIRDGRTIKENITVSETEEDITLSNGTRIIYDFARGLMVMRVEDGEEQSTCYVATFQRQSFEAPSDGDFLSMTEDELDAEGVEYYVDRSYTVKRNILSETAHQMCEDSNMYLMTATQTDTVVDRRKRAICCSRTTVCTCCPWNCVTYLYNCRFC